MTSPTLLTPHSFIAGEWQMPSGNAQPIASAITGETIAEIGDEAPSAGAILSYAKEVGSVALQKLSFHDRARCLKALALHLREHREELYQLSYHSGATLSDSKIDIDGGISTLLVFASKGRREMPDDTIYLDGDIETLSRNGTFLGQHICTSRQGTAVHINAFNFPVWGMLEKLAPAFLAGMPSIIKPATSTCYITEACFKLIVNSQILPTGSVQLVVGKTGNLLNELNSQDVVSFTGSAKTAYTLRSNPILLNNSVRFIAEQDSLNASVLGEDASPDTPEFELFINEAVQEITTKAGQKCTAIRRLLIPEQAMEATIDTLKKRLQNITVGHPADKATQMGALVSQAQREDVLRCVNQLEKHCERVYGEVENFQPGGENTQGGAFLPPILLAQYTALKRLDPYQP